MAVSATNPKAAPTANPATRPATANPAAKGRYPTPQLRAPSTRATQPASPARPASPRVSSNPFDNRAAEVGISDGSAPTARRPAESARRTQPAPRTALPTAPGVRTASGQQPVVGGTSAAARPGTRPTTPATTRPLARPSVTPRQPVVGTPAGTPNSAPGGTNNAALPPRVATRPTTSAKPAVKPTADTRRLNAPIADTSAAPKSQPRRTEVETIPGPRRPLFDNGPRTNLAAESTPGYQFPPRSNYRETKSDTRYPSRPPAATAAPVRTAQREEPKADPTPEQAAPIEQASEHVADTATEAAEGEVGEDGSTPVLLRTKTPILSVETAGPKSLVIGKKSTFKITLSNRGEAAAGDVNVLIKIPPWAEVVNPEAMAIGGEGRASQGPAGIAWRFKATQAATE